MQRPIVVIGLGNFGSRLATSLAERGTEVVAIDRRRDIVEALRDKVTLSVALDATNEDALRSNLPDNAAAAVVGIGDNFEAILMATVLLKKLGVPRVIARADSQLKARILTEVGADETVNPEEESADRWTNRVAAPKLLNQIEFHEGYSIVEIHTPAAWVGQTLQQLNLRSTLGLHVVAVKTARADGVQRIAMPKPGTPLLESDILILMGKDEDFANVPTQD